MENERLVMAIGRMERALSRIETAARNSPATGTGFDTANVNNERQEALKAEMRHAIEKIDGLIAERERG